jgi:hypothetical protein
MWIHEAREDPAAENNSSLIGLSSLRPSSRRKICGKIKSNFTEPPARFA